MTDRIPDELHNFTHDASRGILGIASLLKEELRQFVCLTIDQRNDGEYALVACICSSG